MTSRVTAVVCVLLGSGCSLLASTSVGQFRSTNKAIKQTGAAATARVGHYTHTDAMSYGVAVGLRTKVASQLKQYSISADVSVSPRLSAVVPFLRGGANIYQVESVAGEFAYGMLSPYAQAGLMVQLSRRADGTRIYLTAAGSLEYDLRFTSQPSQGYWGMLGGIAIAAPRAKPERIRFAPK